MSGENRRGVLMSVTVFSYVLSILEGFKKHKSIRIIKYADITKEKVVDSKKLQLQRNKIIRKSERALMEAYLEISLAEG